MWDLIDGLMLPNDLVTDKSILNYDQVFAIYSKLVELDQIFREMLQISILKKEIQKENNFITE